MPWGRTSARGGSWGLSGYSAMRVRMCKCVHVFVYIWVHAYACTWAPGTRQPGTCLKESHGAFLLRVLAQPAGLGAVRPLGTLWDERNLHWCPLHFHLMPQDKNKIAWGPFSMEKQDSGNANAPTVLCKVVRPRASHTCLPKKGHDPHTGTRVNGPCHQSKEPSLWRF